MRTFAIGDIHGHLAFLDALLVQLRERAEPGDTLVFVGDYIDRGPDSKGVVDRVMNLQAGGWDGPVITLRGNHEDMLLDCLRQKREYEPGCWLMNGAEETLSSYGSDDGQPRRPTDLTVIIPPAHLAFFEDTLHRYEDEHAHYVHAGFEPGFPVEQQARDTMLWIRDPFINREYAWDKVVVFGHTPMFEGLCKGRGPATNWQPLNTPHKIGIDTGSCYGGHLTAVMLPEREFFVVKEARDSDAR